MNCLILNFLIVFSILSHDTIAQIPTMEGYESDLTKKQSLIFNQFQNQYDFLIAFNESSYWWKHKNKIKKRNTINYQILGLAKNSWEKLILSTRIKKNDKLNKPKIIKYAYPAEKAEKLISELSNLSFWTLHNDSLNVRRKWISDSTFVAFGVSDGPGYSFEIMTKYGFKVIRSYYPEFFHEKIPRLRQVDLFIKAKNKFEAAIKN